MLVTTINSKKAILVVTLILILIGSFLRFYGLDKVYTEYDDVGVVSIHKGHVGSKNIDVTLGGINATLQVDMDSAYSIENTMMLPFYIAYTWTYAPAQYIFLPLLLNDNDVFDSVVFKGRAISAFFSILSIVFLAYLMYMVSGRVVTWMIPIVLTIPIFSANSILYAHHMGPYSAYFFSTCVGLIILHKYHTSKITLRQTIVILSLFIYLSYLVALFAVPVFLLYLHKIKYLHKYRNLKKYARDVISVSIGVFIALPALLLVKSNVGNRSIMLTDMSSVLDMSLHLAEQSYIAVKSILYGIIRTDYLLVIFLVVIVLLLISRLVNNQKNLNESRIYIVSVLSILFQWLVLYIFGAVPLDETRHMLIIAPVIIVIAFYVLKDIDIKNYGIIVTLTISILSYSSIIYSIDLIKSKFSNFNYSLLDKRDESVILLYRFTLGPMKYYDNSDKEVYFIDMNSFQKNYFKMKFPDKMLLVSQQAKIYDEEMYDKYKEKLPQLFCNYSIHPLYETDNEIFFTYNNYQVSSNKNGMFVYQMRKTSVNQCQFSK